MAKRKPFTYITGALAYLSSKEATRWEVKIFEFGFYIHIYTLEKGQWKLLDVTTRNTPEKLNKFITKETDLLRAKGYNVRDVTEANAYITEKGFYEAKSL